MTTQIAARMIIRLHVFLAAALITVFIMGMLAPNATASRRWGGGYYVQKNYGLYINYDAVKAAKAAGSPAGLAFTKGWHYRLKCDTPFPIANPRLVKVDAAGRLDLTRAVVTSKIGVYSRDGIVRDVSKFKSYTIMHNNDSGRLWQGFTVFNPNSLTNVRVPKLREVEIAFGADPAGERRAKEIAYGLTQMYDATYLNAKIAQQQGLTTGAVDINTCGPVPAGASIPGFTSAGDKEVAMALNGTGAEWRLQNNYGAHKDRGFAWNRTYDDPATAEVDYVAPSFAAPFQHNFDTNGARTIADSGSTFYLMPTFYNGKRIANFRDEHLTVVYQPQEQLVEYAHRYVSPRSQCIFRHAMSSSENVEKIFKYDTLSRTSYGSNRYLGCLQVGGEVPSEVLPNGDANDPFNATDVE